MRTSKAPRILAWFVTGVALATLAPAAPKPSGPAPPIKVHVDATAAPRGVFHCRLELPVRPGPLTLTYPRWIPGEHSPTGPITQVVGLRFRAGGREIRWRRDPVDMFGGKGVPGRSKLYVGGSLVAVTELPYSLVASAGFYGVTCGYAHADSVDPAAFRPPFRFSGEIERVVLDTAGDATVDDEVELQALLAHQ